jgi:acyl carrier protein
MLNTLFESVKSILNDGYITIPLDIQPSTRLIEDIGLDSLDQVEFVMELEKEFDLSISEIQAEQCKTVEDACNLIELLQHQAL